MMMRERDHIMLSTPPFFSSSVRRVPAFWAISGVMPTRCIWASSAGILSREASANWAATVDSYP